MILTDEQLKRLNKAVDKMASEKYKLAINLNYRVTVNYGR